MSSLYAIGKNAIEASWQFNRIHNLQPRYYEFNNYYCKHDDVGKLAFIFYLRLLKNVRGLQTESFDSQSAIQTILSCEKYL